MSRTGVTYIIIAFAGVLLVLYSFKSMEVDCKDKEIVDLSDKVKNLNLLLLNR